MSMDMSMEMVIVTTIVFTLVALAVGLAMGMARWHVGRDVDSPAVTPDPQRPGTPRANLYGWSPEAGQSPDPSTSMTPRDSGSTD